MNTQNKVSIHYRVLTLILAIIMCVTCVPDLTAFAGDSAGGAAKGTPSGYGGTSYLSTGYRLYIVDGDGKLIENYVADLHDPYWQTINSGYPNDTTYANYLRVCGSNYSGTIPEYHYADINANIPVCVNSDCKGQGAVLRDWFNTKVEISGKEHTNLKLVCHKLWGAGASQYFGANPPSKAYLIVEPLFSTQIGMDSSAIDWYDREYAGTWYGFMKTLSRKNKNGDYIYACRSGRFIKWMRHATGDGYVFTKDVEELGINKPPYEIDSTPDATLSSVDAYAAGWGIQAYWNSSNKGSGDPISTYDIDNNPTTPSTTEKPKNTDKIKNDAKSAGRKNGEVEIVKLYGYAYKRKDWKNDERRFVKVEQTDNRKNGDNKSITGYFLRKKTTDKIVIQDESDATGFAVWEWRTSKKLESKYSNAYTVEEWVSAKDDGKLNWDFDRANGATKYWSIGSNATNTAKNGSYKRYYKYNKKSAPTDYLTLDSDEKTLYVLYIRQMPYINTSTGDGSGSGTGDRTGQFNIVKVYGKYDEVTGSVEHVKTVAYTQSTYDVNIQDESGWSLMNWRISKDAPDKNYKATEWVDGNISRSSTYGYEDGFDKTTANNSHTLLTDTSAKGVKVAGSTYADVSVRTTITTNGSFSGTVWCKDLVKKNSGGTIYLLFLKKGEGETYDFGIQDAVIPESYIVKRDIMSDRNMTITSSGGTTSTKKITKHKFIWYNPDVTATINSWVSNATAQKWTDANLTFVLDMLNKGTYNTNYTSGLLMQRSHARSVSGISSTLNPSSPSSIYTSFSAPSQDTSWKRTVTFKKFVKTRHTGTGFDFISILYRRGDETILADWKHTGTDAVAANAKSYMSGSSAYPALTKYGFKNLSSVSTGSLEGYRAENDHAGTKLRFTLNYKFGFASGSDYTRTIWKQYKVTVTTGGTTTTKTKTSTKNLLTYPLNGSSNVNGNDVRINDLDMGVKVQVYAGESGRGDGGTLSAKEVTGTFNGWKYSGTKSTSDNPISFYPYIKMQTQSDVNLVNFSNKDAYNKTVYVMAQYKRSLNPVSYGGIQYKLATNLTSYVVPSGVGATSNGLIHVSSDQWSTHASATQRTNNGAVLPGGATMNIAVPSNNRQTIIVESYIPMLVGTGRTQVNKTGGSDGGLKDIGALSDVQKIHKSYAITVAESLETLNVAQWVSEKVNYEEGKPDKLYVGKLTNPVWKLSGAKEYAYSESDTSKESKYYFRIDGNAKNDEQTVTAGNGADLLVNDAKTKNGAVNNADLDVNAVSKANATVTYYTFFTTPEGEIRVKYGSDLSKVGTVRYIDSDNRGSNWITTNPGSYSDGTVEVVLDRDTISKFGNSSVDTVNAKLSERWKVFNTKTEIISRLINSLELGTGNDKKAYWSLSDGKWYNEAFDGITYAVFEQEMQVGTISTAERTAILDPALTPSSANKGDLFTAFAYSQFRSRGYTENNGSANRNMVGKFRNNKVYMGSSSGKDMETFFVSDIFYIPNANVQDLK